MRGGVRRGVRAFGLAISSRQRCGGVLGSVFVWAIRQAEIKRAMQKGLLYFCVLYMFCGVVCISQEEDENENEIKIK